VINKSDLPSRIDLGRLRESLESLESKGGAQVVRASATSPGGTGKLEEKLRELVLAGRAVHSREGGMVTSLRHLDALRRAREHVDAALGTIEAGAPAAFVAVDLHSALNALGEITGETAGEDLLDEIFRNFCIGK